MRKIQNFITKYSSKVAYALVAPVYAASGTVPSDLSVSLGWDIPSIGEILTFVIRFFFVMAGLLALFFLLLGALGWVTSGGSKEGVEKAREKIVAAVVGVVLIVVVLSIIWTLEKVVFHCNICFGIACPLTIPSIIPGSANVIKPC